VAKRPLIFPFGGRSDSGALYAQPGFTTKSARNVRGRDPVTGRIRGSQRAGMSKFCATPLGSGKVKALVSTALDDRRISYSFTAGQESQLWSVATPSKTSTLGVVTDRQGNVYAIDGNAGVAKYNSAGKLLMKVALPVADAGHIVRALFVDDADRIFAGVSAGGDVRTAKVFCVLQRPQPGQVAADDPNQFFILWELTPGAYTEELKVYRGSQLYCAHNYPQENRARVVVYDGLGLEPAEVNRIESVAYPINSLDIDGQGNLYTASQDAQRNAVDTSARQGHPDEAKGKSVAVPLTGWKPTDGVAAGDFKIHAWYSAKDPDSLNETDLDQTGKDTPVMESGQQVLRWRDKSGAGRNFYSGVLALAGEKGPSYRKVGIGGQPCLFFDNSTADTKNSLVTFGNSSIQTSLASQQLTAIPAYTGSMWCMVMLLRPTQDDDAGSSGPRVVFAHENEAAGASDHVLFVNRDCSATLPGAYTKGYVSYFATTDVAPDDGNCATADQALGFPFLTFGSPNVNGALLVTVLWDGGVDPADMTKTRCVVRVNGRPVDRFEGKAFESIQPSWLGLGPASISATLVNIERRFKGELAELIVIGRRDPTSNTEPKVLTHDKIDVGDPDAAQTDTSMARLEAYVAYGWGCGSLLRNNQGAEVGFGNYTHFYARNLTGGRLLGGPPLPGTGGLWPAGGEILNTFALVAKHDAQGILRWVCNWATHPDGSSVHGGLGYGVRARKVESDGKVHVWCAGFQPANSNASITVDSTIDVRKIIDNGASFSGLQADGAWRHSFTGAGQLGYHYPRMASDKFGNLYFPGYNTGGGTIKPLHVFAKDPDGSGNAVERTTFTLTAPADDAHAVAIPPDALTPDYRTDLATGPAEVVYLATVAASTTFESLWKIRLVATNSSASGSPRTVVTVGVVEDDIKTITELAVATPTGGSGAIDATSQYIEAFQADREIVVMDGLAYKVYSPLTGLVTALEATSAGEIPPRGKIGCMWRHRLVIGRFADKPGRYCASAVGDIRDWDFRREPRLSTMAFDASLTRAGEVEDSIVALIPASDDLLFVLGESRILRLTGDPQAGGQIDKVTDSLGGTFGRSWCKDKADRIFIFGNPPGLYLLPQQGNDIVNLTERTIEDTEFVNIDYSTHRVELAYDPIQLGVRIDLVAHGAASEVVDSWFFEEKTHELVRGGSIWTDRVAVTGKLLSASTFLAGDSTRTLLVGCEDGYVRMIDPAAADDDGSPIDSFVVMGPLNDARSMDESKLISTQVVLADDQQGCRLELFGSEQAEIIGPIRAATDLSPGMNDPFRGRVRGNYLWARLRSALVGRRWAMERGTCEIVATAAARNRDT